MLLDILTSTPAADILQRTSSSVRVQHVVQLSLSPVFLLAAIGAVMNVMTSRLIWVANKIDKITAANKAGRGDDMVKELPALELRRVYAQRAVMLSTAAALTISIVIVLLFISAFVRAPMGSLVALSWIVTMGFIVAGLAFFLMETRTAAKRNRERMKESLENG
ncbi:MAG: DUF2721 domain-containing protein [Erythrobacter sp.]